MQNTDFRLASERLALGVNAVAEIAKCIPPQSAFLLLRVLDRDDRIYGEIVYNSLERINAQSDRDPIEWELGRGVSGLGRGGPEGFFPHVWTSAHQAAWEISRIVLEYFWRPLGLPDDSSRIEYDELTPEQKELFKNLLAEDQRKAIAMTLREIAALQERMKRERARLLMEAENGGATPNTNNQTEEPTLLERACSILTPQQSKLFEYLWNKETARFSMLHMIEGAFRVDSPTDEATIAALKKMRTRLNENELPVTVRISESGRRVTLDKLTEN